ncbi:hypothetical protein MPSEU_000077100 [Mayamaea pseudoterrestris]|nr:hypothetical protein MPSEU_000077100 [Mayamaea pseudoterrestris]
MHRLASLRSVASRCVGVVRNVHTSAADYRIPTKENVAAFRTLLDDDASALMQGKSDLEHRNVDWTHHYKGQSELLLKPSTAAQISKILVYCNEHRIPIVTQAGKTGLVGGSVPMGQEVILSTERLNHIHGIDSSGILKSQAGCILQDLQTYCAERSFLFPVDLGAKGTCQIGGNVATNAGGQYYYRYGSIAANLLGMEVVLADGRILQCRSNIKDNTGYKVHQMFVGSEGTLGIITEVSFLCPPLPTSKQAVFLACRTYSDVLKVMKEAKSSLGEVMAAFEWMDQAIVRLVDERHVRCPLPIHDEYRYFLLIETHGSNEHHDLEKMEGFLDKLLSNAAVADGVLAQDLTQMQSFWKLRESANPVMAGAGYTYKYDVSLPIECFEEFAEHMKQHLTACLVVHGDWGHILDGNLHFNVCTPGVTTVDEQVLARLEPYLFEQVMLRNGSISAEHGLGQSKNKYLTMVHDEATLVTMRQVKRLFDPNCILNPGKYLPVA